MTDAQKAREAEAVINSFKSRCNNSSIELRYNKTEEMLSYIDENIPDTVYKIEVSNEAGYFINFYSLGSEAKNFKEELERKFPWG